jgi:hypothetical protein
MLSGGNVNCAKATLAGLSASGQFARCQCPSAISRLCFDPIRAPKRTLSTHFARSSISSKVRIGIIVMRVEVCGKGNNFSDSGLRRA